MLNLGLEQLVPNATEENKELTDLEYAMLVQDSFEEMREIENLNRQLQAKLNSVQQLDELQKIVEKYPDSKALEDAFSADLETLGLSLEDLQNSTEGFLDKLKQGAEWTWKKIKELLAKLWTFVKRVWLKLKVKFMATDAKMEALFKEYAKETTIETPRWSLNQIKTMTDGLQNIREKFMKTAQDLTDLNYISSLAKNAKDEYYRPLVNLPEYSLGFYIEQFGLDKLIDIDAHDYLKYTDENILGNLGYESMADFNRAAGWIRHANLENRRYFEKYFEKVNLFTRDPRIEELDEKIQDYVRKAYSSTLRTIYTLIAIHTSFSVSWNLFVATVEHNLKWER